MANKCDAYPPSKKLTRAWNIFMKLVGENKIDEFDKTAWMLIASQNHISYQRASDYWYCSEQKRKEMVNNKV